jgi:Uma2 family endonuclease
MQTAVLISPEEYLAQERLADYKSEYFEGEIFPMAGASLKHNLLAASIIRILIPKLMNTEFTVMQSDLRVHNPITESFMYPDIVIVGEDIEMLDDGENDTLLNPLVIIEILSPSTAEYDKTTKFEAYKRLDSLQEYILVAQDQAHVEIFTRTGANTWSAAEFTSRSDNAPVSSIQVNMPLASIYERIMF